MGEFELQKIAKLEEELKLYKTPDYKLAELIDPATFANRLLSLGWVDTVFSTKQTLIIQFLKDGKLEYQCNIPVNNSLGDFVFTIRYAAKQLATFLKQDTKQVLVDLVLRTRSGEK